MRKHENFEELAALAAIGQLSVEEHGDFWKHLRGCAACRRTSDQFNFVLDELPLTRAFRERQRPPAVAGRELSAEILGESFCRRRTFYARGTGREETNGLQHLSLEAGVVCPWCCLPLLRSLLSLRQLCFPRYSLGSLLAGQPFPIRGQQSCPHDALASSDSSARISEPASVTIAHLQQTSVRRGKTTAFLAEGACPSTGELPTTAARIQNVGKDQAVQLRARANRTNSSWVRPRLRSKSSVRTTTS